MNVIILGPQGSGKGTQAQMLVDRYGFYCFEAGGFLRRLANTDPDVNEKLNRGELIDDDRMFELVKRELMKKGVFDQVVFDGYPRSVRQWELLKEWLGSRGAEVDLVIFLDISEVETVRRLSARRLDRKTGKIYNLITSPPGSDVDLGDLVQRDDDKEAAIKERLNEYRENTVPLLEVFEKEGKLVKLDGERPIEEIFEDIAHLIGGKSE